MVSVIHSIERRDGASLDRSGACGATDPKRWRGSSGHRPSSLLSASAPRTRGPVFVRALPFLIAAAAFAQEPAGAPPRSSNRAEGLYVRELLPDLGQIGAQVGVTLGLCANPYEAGRGACGGGFVALPLARVPGGRLSYEIDISLARSRGEPFFITSTLAYIANLAAGASPAAAATGPPAAPYPVSREVRTALRVLRVSPFGLRYALSGHPVPRLRPYVAAGIDAVVVLSAQEPLSDEGTDLPASAGFDSVLIGGLTAQAPELDALGLPSGQGNVQLGAHAAAGVEARLAARLSLNLEYTFVAIEGASQGQHAVRAAVGFHW